MGAHEPREQGVYRIQRTERAISGFASYALFGVAGPVTISVTADGYRESTVEVLVPSSMQHDFILTPIGR